MENETHLIFRWFDLCNSIDWDLPSDKKFDIENLKNLLDETRKYLTEQNCECGVIKLETAEILGYIKAFCNYPILPAGVDVAEYNTCRRIADGLFCSAVHQGGYDKMTISYGWIHVMEGGHEINLDMNNFDTAFELCMSLFND